MTQPIPFGKYYLLERINVGGMAEVFKAKAVGVEGFERVVAVKRILPSIAEDQEFITMFIDEAKIAVQLTHANIAQIFDLGRVDDSYFIALEYVHGKDLRAIFNRARTRGKPLPIALCCYAIMKVCEGLEYAHNKRDAAGQFLNLVHRDVSPQNLLVSYEGEVKIIDFGIAKAAGKAGNTQAGILKGKFGYMSPEQAQGFEIDRRSDLFAVGICLYELLTGERAFLGETDFATIENVRNVNIIPPRTHNPAIPEELERIVLKALTGDREQRHQAAQQLQQELQTFLRSSGKPLDRRELSLYMQREFAEELERENLRDREYAAIAEEEADHSDLAVFDDIGTQQAAFELHRPSPRRVRQPKHKITLHGVPMLADATPPRGAWSGAIAQRRRVSNPPRQSGVPLAAHELPAGVRSARLATPSQLNVDMEWDEEELSTQIYDPPEERAASGSGSGLPMNTIEGLPPPDFLRGAATPAAAQRSMTPAALRPAEPASPGAAVPWTAGFGGPWTAKTDISWPPDTAAQRARLLAVSGVAIALLALGVFLWFFHAAASGVIQLQTMPRDVSVSIDGRPVGGVSPFVIRGITVGSPHTIAVQRSGYRAWASRFELQSDQPLRLPDVALEPVESGFALDSVPSGASVFVDGRRLEQTTPVRIAALSAGDHRVRVEAQGYLPWESSLRVTVGSVLDLPVAQLIARTAEPYPGGSRPNAPPPADIAPRHSVPARTAAPPRAATPPRTTAPPGTTQAIAPVPGDGKPGATQSPSQASPSAGTSVAAAGTLRAQTRPWSTVFVDGHLVGNTPLMNVSIKAGHHTLSFVNEEFGIRKNVTIVVEPGQVVTQVLKLTE